MMLFAKMQLRLAGLSPVHASRDCARLRPDRLGPDARRCPQTGLRPLTPPTTSFSSSCPNEICIDYSAGEGGPLVVYSFVPEKRAVRGVLPVLNKARADASDATAKLT
jgi:hypothetical protein